MLFCSLVGDSLTHIGNSDEERRNLFNEKLLALMESTGTRGAYYSEEHYNKILHEVQEAQRKRSIGESMSSKEYRRLKRYDIIDVGPNKKLIEKTAGNNEPIRYYCKLQDYFDVIEKAHEAVGHQKLKGK